MRTLGAIDTSPYRRLRPMLVPPRQIIYKASIEQLSEIEALAAQFDAPLASAILHALETQQDLVNLDEVVLMLQSGNINGVLTLLESNEAIAALKAGIKPAVQAATYAAGGFAAGLIRTAIGGAQFVFDQLNPRLIEWLQSYSLNLIREINDKTKEGIRTFLIDGMTAGLNPKAVGSRLKGIIGLTDRQAKAVANYRKELETFHLRQSAAGYGLGTKIDRVNGTQVFKPSDDGTPKDGIDLRRLRDFRYDGRLKGAMATGKPLTPAQIDKMVAAYQRKYLAYRSRTIARTEAIRTTNMGVQDAWQQAIEEGKVSEALVRRQWIVAEDERLCSVCAQIPGMNPAKGVTMGQSFNTPIGPLLLSPAHPNCRCTVFIRLYEPKQLAAVTST